MGARLIVGTNIRNPNSKYNNPKELKIVDGLFAEAINKLSMKKENLIIFDSTSLIIFW